MNRKNICSVSQGSVLSGLLYIIYTLDMHQQLHKIKHVYVDDCYRILKGNREDIRMKVTYYINKMKKYYKTNRLAINIDKTKVLIVTKGKQLINSETIINNNIIKNVTSLKILGTILNNNLDWNDHYMKGTNALIPNIKRRISILRNI